MVDSGNGGPRDCREWRTPGMADLNRVNCVLFGLYISERQLEPDPTSEQASFLGFCASSPWWFSVDWGTAGEIIPSSSRISDWSYRAKSSDRIASDIFCPLFHWGIDIRQWIIMGIVLSPLLRHCTSLCAAWFDGFAVWSCSDKA